jgi:hypothetical protein
MAESFGFLLDTAIRRFDAVCTRHARRSPPGSADARMLASRRRLLVERAFADDWVVSDERARDVEATIAMLEAMTTEADEATRLDRFALQVLTALERRRPERLARDALDMPLTVEML